MSIDSLFKQLQKSKKPKERELLKGLIGHGTRYLVAEGRKKIVKEYKGAEVDNISKLSPEDKAALRDLDKRLLEAVKVGMLDKEKVEAIRQCLYDPKKAVKLFDAAIKEKIDLLEKIKQAAIRKFIEIAAVYTKLVSAATKKTPEVKLSATKAEPVALAAKSSTHDASQDTNPTSTVTNKVPDEEKRVLDIKWEGNRQVQEELEKKDDQAKDKSKEEKKKEEEKLKERKREFSAHLDAAIRSAHLSPEVKALVQVNFNPDLMKMTPEQLAEWIRTNLSA